MAGDARGFLRRVVPVLLAGFAGTLAHAALMLLKDGLGLLPAFQPYEALQRALFEALGPRAQALAAGDGAMAALAPFAGWALSSFNGAVVAGFVFARLYARLPGGAGWRRGLVFGLGAWLVMGGLLFPALGLGPFGWAAGGAGAAAFSLAMLLAYGATMGAAYGALRGD